MFGARNESIEAESTIVDTRASRPRPGEGTSPS